MPLTYQPFAQVPAVRALEEELKHNVSHLERYGSVVAAVGIAAGAFFSRGLGRLLLLSSAGALAYRGLTGHCHVYETLGVSTRKPETASSGQVIYVGKDPSHGQAAPESAA